MNEIDNILYENLSPDRYCLVHNKITKLQQENQELKNKIQDLQADYGTQAQIERDMLRQENKELKKQLNEYIASDLKLKNELYRKRKEYQETYKDVRIEIKEYKTQQKEFIEYLELEIKGYEAISDLLFSHNKELKVYKEILSKYKEIVNSFE